MTKKELQEQLKQSMLARDEHRTSVLRMLISAIGYYEIQKGGAGYEATPEDVLAVIHKEAKQRKDSIAQFSLAQRPELVEKETKELHMLEHYLPAQMPEEEIRKIVTDAITQTNATNMSDIGKLMGVIMPKLKGRADGNVVNKIIRESLQNPS